MKCLMYISKHAEATIDISIPDGSGYEPCNFEIFLFPSCTENKQQRSLSINKNIPKNPQLTKRLTLLVCDSKK